jgi:predicted acetyltransferase
MMEVGMKWDVRPCSSLEELRSAVAPIWQYFGLSVPADEQFDRIGRVLSPERMDAARENGQVVGGAGALPFTLTIPGGRIAAAGVTAVAVLPTHRRRGILTALMRAQLDACRRRGEAVAYLWATEDVIYGRFGYGVASFTAEIDVARERSAFHTLFEPAGTTRLVPVTEAEGIVAPVYERVAAATPGMFTRTPEWWRARSLSDPHWRRRGGGEMQCVVVDSGRSATAYALYRLNVAFDRGVQTGSVEVIEAMGDSPEATRTLWRFLLDIDWMARLRAALLPVDHPLLLLAAEPRRLRMSVRDGLWVRLVDVEAALAPRAYAAQGAGVVDVKDSFCPWNEGRVRIGADRVARTSQPPDLRCDVTALGSVYLGGFTWAQLARAGRVEELHPGAIGRADALFRTQCAPWCPEVF